MAPVPRSHPMLFSLRNPEEMFDQVQQLVPRATAERCVVQLQKQQAVLDQTTHELNLIKHHTEVAHHLPSSRLTAHESPD